MSSNYLDILTQPSPKKSRREEILRLAMELFTLASLEDATDVVDQKDGTGPELYVAPRISPSP